MTKTIKPITDEELASLERVQAWMREAASVLEIKEIINYEPDELHEAHIINGAGSITFTETDTRVAVLDFLNVAFEIRRGRDFHSKCPRIFASSLALCELRQMEAIKG